MAEPSDFDRVRELIERSSLGTEAARLLGARTSDERVRGILDRLHAIQSVANQQATDPLEQRIIQQYEQYRDEINARWQRLERRIEDADPGL